MYRAWKPFVEIGKGGTIVTLFVHILQAYILVQMFDLSSDLVMDSCTFTMRFRPSLLVRKGGTNVTPFADILQMYELVQMFGMCSERKMAR